MSRFQEPNYDWNDPSDYPGADYENEEPDYVDPTHEDLDSTCTECDGTGLVNGHLCKPCQGSGIA